jgi:hypothetical protein
VAACDKAGERKAQLALLAQNELAGGFEQAGCVVIWHLRAYCEIGREAVIIGDKDAVAAVGLLPRGKENVCSR